MTDDERFLEVAIEQARIGRAETPPRWIEAQRPSKGKAARQATSS